VDNEIREGTQFLDSNNGLNHPGVYGCRPVRPRCDSTPTSTRSRPEFFHFVSTDLPPFQFSVSPGSTGQAGSAVSREANCSPPEPQADVFESGLNRVNLQGLDGDGTAYSTDNGYGLYLIEGPSSDNIDALERDPCQSVDLDCDGEPEAPIYLTLAPGSPTLSEIGATPADILMTDSEYMPIIWAQAGDLGLVSGDIIDALCINDHADGVYAIGDQVLFSLAPGSPTLSAILAGPADLLRPSPPMVFYSAEALGLSDSDDVDALVCAKAMTFQDVFLQLPPFTIERSRISITSS